MSIRQHDFTIERRFRQTPAQTFRAFADPELKHRWFGVPEGWTDTERELDFRVGGGELSVGRDPRGTLHEFRSRYHDIVDGERIVFAYDLLLDGRLISVSLTTVEVRPDGDGTRLVFTEHGAFFDDLEDPRSASTAPGCCSTGSPPSSVSRSSHEPRWGHHLPHVDLARRVRRRAGSESRAPAREAGREVHRWHLGDERANEADEIAAGWLMRPRGAYVMGRNMFGPIRGEWEEDWRGWWGPEPPYHAPVFVLTHHARESIEMEGGTTFHFVTDGFDAAFAQARERPATTAWTSRAAPPRFGRRSLPGSSTSSRSTSPRSCSGPASGSSTASDLSGWSPSRCCTRRWPRTSATAERAEGRRQSGSRFREDHHSMS